MRLYDLVNEVNIDNEKGWGSVPYNQNVDYMGLKVLMRPSVFLKLAAYIETPTSSKDIATHIKSGGSIGAPFLLIKFPREWEDSDFTNPAFVVGHEGRNRMMAIKQVEGDDPVETHLFFSGNVRRKHITDQMITELNKTLIPQEGRSFMFSGPYFKVIG